MYGKKKGMLLIIGACLLVLFLVTVKHKAEMLLKFLYSIRHGWNCHPGGSIQCWQIGGFHVLWV